MSLPFRHLTSASQLTPEVVQAIFRVADDMATIRKTQGRSRILADRVVALLFYEPSSRTMLSFQAAASRLGAGMIVAQGKEMSSMKKGESIEDTIRMVMGYADLIVMRHPESGAAERAASVSAVPFINAGDGGNEHPTQALLDLYTIWKEKGRLSNLHVAFACDPLHSRTIRSLARSLSHYPGNRFTFISPPSLRASPALLAELRGKGVVCTESSSLSDGTNADILYMNRLQEERFTDPGEFQRLRKEFILTAPMLSEKNVTIMDPLPRIDEIDPSVDALPNARYFAQAHNGIPIRMALLAMMLGKA
ncbi:MAG: aspartate carbamoyltransferase [Patescibacteria group bacterium]